MFARRPLLVAVVALLAACDGTRSHVPTEQPQLELVYGRIAESGPELMSLDVEAEGASPARLLPAGVRAMHPAMHPDMRRIAYASDDPVTTDRDVWVAGPNMVDRVRLADSPEIDDSPAWSPDGSRIAFRSWRTERAGEIWTMRHDGSDPRNLTPVTGNWLIDYRHPTWSPSGELIAYSSDESGNRDIWIMRASDGGGRRQLTSTLDADSDPAWSPDGNTILFTRSGPQGTYIMAIDPEGGPTVRLTYEGHASDAAWSPDGSMIAFTRRQSSPRERGEIYTMMHDGTGIRLRTTDPAWGGGQNPTWRTRTQ